jgi:CheY-like chemotaxis protein
VFLPGENLAVTASARPHQDILIVDDRLTLCARVAAILQDVGYQITTATSGQEACAQITDHVPDLILMGRHMPVRTGWELQEQLGAQGSCVPVVLLPVDLEAQVAAACHHATGSSVRLFDADTLIATVTQIALN